ncbi:MAG TPA: hypothetical protein VFB38_06555 [Chthonomonadaceae bacterium]|nr:hypothetical protein [Chthonomonadaceae bacterium]
MRSFRPPRHFRPFRRLPALLLCAALPMAILITGCYKDRPGAYPVVASANGDIRSMGSTEALPPLTAKTPRVAKDKVPAASVPGEADFGVPFYPGAKPHTGLDGVPRASRESDGTLLLLLETPDPVEKVVAFYRSRLPKASFSEAIQEGKRVQTVTKELSDHGLQSIEISASGDKTQILLMRIPALNSSGETPMPPDAAQLLKQIKTAEGLASPSSTEPPPAASDSPPTVGAPAIGKPLPGTHPGEVLPDPTRPHRPAPVPVAPITPPRDTTTPGITPESSLSNSEPTPPPISRP